MSTFNIRQPVQFTEDWMASANAMEAWAKKRAERQWFQPAPHHWFVCYPYGTSERIKIVKRAEDYPVGKDAKAFDTWDDAMAHANALVAIFS